MKYTICSIVIAFGCLFFANSSASAIDGRTAVGMCIDSKIRCAWSVNDQGEIDICNKNGCVYCPSATGQCTIASSARPRPFTATSANGSNPAGAERKAVERERPS